MKNHNYKFQDYVIVAIWTRPDRDGNVLLAVKIYRDGAKTGVSVLSDSVKASEMLAEHDAWFSAWTNFNKSTDETGAKIALAEFFKQQCQSTLSAAVANAGVDEQYATNIAV